VTIDKDWQNLVRAFRQRGFADTHFVRRDELMARYDRMLDRVRSVGFGGSVTTRELGLPERARQRGLTVWDHWEVPAHEKARVRREQLSADLFVTAINAVTRSGIMVNADGVGNRVAASIFGPDRVLFIVTPNKLVDNLEMAFHRIRHQATPRNARRLGIQTPCSGDFVCRNCLTDQKMDRVFSFFEYRPTGMNATVFLLDEDLGY